MTYQEAIAYLNSFVNYEKKETYSYRDSFKLERIRDFLRCIGNPQESLKCLHVAGTKGKGSVCAYLAYILKESGFRVGLYTSPHLASVRERIRVLSHQSSVSSLRLNRDFEGMITKKELGGLIEKLKPAIEDYNLSSKHGPLSFFEVYTVLAFLYFKVKKVDYAVLETGLGGRLDATNTVYPLVCGIAPISYDHMDKLGTTLKEIAREKAGIIKSQEPRAKSRHSKDKKQNLSSRRTLLVVSAMQGKEAQEVIRRRCREKNAKLYEVGKDILWYKPKRIKGIQRFNIKGAKGNYKDLMIRFFGEHQLDNAALAVGMIEALGDKKIRASSIKKGLKNTIWPGRLEIVSYKPIVLLDGAQNAASAFALKKAIRDYFSGYKKLILVLGMSADKDIKGFCNAFSGFAGEIILTKSNNPRAADPKFIKNNLGRQVHLTYNVKKAVALAKRLCHHQDLILITGSLFVVGEARDLLLKEND